MTGRPEKRPGFLFGRIFYGWVIVLAAWFIMFFCSGVQLGSFPIFFSELLDYFGWERGELALGLSLNMLSMAVFGPVAGIMLNRIGPRRTVITGAIIGSIAIVFISLTSQPWHFYVTYGFFLPMGVAMAFFIPTVTTVRRWFSRKAALAVSVALTGSGVGLIVGPFAALALIDALDWQTAYRILAGILVAGIILSALLLRKDPESMGTHPDGVEIGEGETGRRIDLAARSESWSVKEAFKTRSIWLYMVAQAGYMVVILAMMGHLKVWADEDLELGEGFAVAMISLMAVAAVVGRLIGGFLSDMLMDRYGRKPILYFGIIGVTIGVWFALTVDSRISIALFVILIGISYGSGVGIFPTYLCDLYGVTTMPILLGLVGLESASVGALGPWMFGTVYDRMGNYDLAFIISGIFCLLSLTCLFFIKAPRKKQDGSGFV